MPDPIETAAATAPTPIESSTPPAAQPAATPAQAATSQTVAPPTAPAAATPAATPAAEVPAWQERLKGWGVDGSQFQSSEQAIDFVLQSAQGLTQNYEQKLAQYEQYIRSLSAPQPAPAAEVKTEQKQESFWNPPEFDPQYTRLVTMDPATGLYKPIVEGGVSPDIVAKANARAAWERKWQTEFANNPFDFMRKGFQDDYKQIEDRAFERAVKYIESRDQGREVQTTVQSTIEQHRDWLYQKDLAGQPLRDAAGRYVLTDKGGSYYRAVEQLANSGVSDPRAQNAIALQMIGHQAAAPAAATRVEQFAGTPATRNLAEALHTTNRAGSLSPTVAGTVGPSPVAGSFLALASQAMAEQGIRLTDGLVTPL